MHHSYTDYYILFTHYCMQIYYVCIMHLYIFRLQLAFLWHKGEGPLRPRTNFHSHFRLPVLNNYLPHIVYSLHSFGAILATNYFKIKFILMVTTILINFLILFTIEVKCVLIHTYIHTYIHMYIHTYICTYIHTYVHTYVHMYVRTFSTFTCYILHLGIIISINCGWIWNTLYNETDSSLVHLHSFHPLVYSHFIILESEGRWSIIYC